MGRQEGGGEGGEGGEGGVGGEGMRRRREEEWQGRLMGN